MLAAPHHLQFSFPVHEPREGAGEERHGHTAGSVQREEGREGSQRPEESQYITHWLSTAVLLPLPSVSKAQISALAPLLFQDHTVNEREMSVEAKRKKDENGTSTSAPNSAVSLVPPRTLLNLLLLSLQTLSKTARARVPRATRRSRWKRRRARGPNLPARRRPSR